MKPQTPIFRVGEAVVVDGKVTSGLGRVIAVCNPKKGTVPSGEELVGMNEREPFPQILVVMMHNGEVVHYNGDDIENGMIQEIREKLVPPCTLQYWLDKILLKRTGVKSTLYSFIGPRVKDMLVPFYDELCVVTDEDDMLIQMSSTLEKYGRLSFWFKSIFHSAEDWEIGIPHWFVSIIIDGFGPTTCQIRTSKPFFMK